MLNNKIRSLAIALTTIVNVAGAIAVSADESLSHLLHGGAPIANPDTPGATYPNIIAPGLKLVERANGFDPLENPSGLITYFGFLSDGTNAPIDSTKTEPDENTYLVFKHGLPGPTPGYNYGKHFLFQGHENAGDLAYVTRINLDVKDPAHRITLLTPVGQDGKTHFNRIDGSTWDPFTETLLLTQENGAAGGVIEITLDWPPVVRTHYGSMGQGGYEGIHPDDRGNILMVEDVGGTGVNIDPNDTNSVKAAKIPNSFVYRFVPYDRSDLSAGGKLQALQVSINGTPLTFVKVDATHPTGDAFSDNQLKLHTVGSSWPCRWITIHDTAVDGSSNFNANAAAKLAGATPFKRPENAQFLPGSDFDTFFFVNTGDTDARSGNVPALAARGAWGSIMRVDFDKHDRGRISTVYLGDAVHTAFDNITFAGERFMFLTEDRGELLHTQLNTLDSIWGFDLKKISNPVRLVGLGRDPLSALSGEDNEPTGVHVSDGGTSIKHLYGEDDDLDEDARWFFTQQHGFNSVFEIISKDDDDHDHGHDHD